MEYKFIMISGTMRDGKAKGFSVQFGVYSSMEVTIKDRKPRDNQGDELKWDNEIVTYLNHRYASYVNGAVLVAIEG
ncbi:MAG: hypothetical protein ABSA71_15425 [Desulfomonilia bacterium]|jgi:hypothetical protein